MAEKIAFENGRISNCEGLITLTLDRVILHTIVHHSLTSSTSTYKPNFIEIEGTFCGWTDVRKYARMDGRTFETGFIRSALSKSRPKKSKAVNDGPSNFTMLTTIQWNVKSIHMMNCHSGTWKKRIQKTTKNTKSQITRHILRYCFIR